ncbi:MAG: hypothetical protein H6753_05955 [Candidatus Omnitrophica bacterium]|nr:hypothetical protein [Candidatus Omnitrophota bacterium]
MKQKIKQLSALTSEEVDLMMRLEWARKPIYTREELYAQCKNKSKADYLIKQLLRKSRLKSLSKNIYLLIPIRVPGASWGVNEFLASKALVRGSRYYIAYSGVFNSYGFTEQVAAMVHVINEKYSLKKNICGVRYQFIKKKADRFYGLVPRMIDGEEIVFPSKERALIDVFEFYGDKSAEQILKAQLSRINVELLVEYVVQYPVVAIRRRMGFALENCGVEKRLLKKIQVGDRGYTPLYNFLVRKGPINKSWRLIING